MTVPPARVIASFIVVAATCMGAAGPDGRPQPVPAAELMRKYVLVGRTGEPLFKPVRVVGVVVDGPHKGWEGGPNVRVQRVNGRATQEDIQLPLRPGDLGDEDGKGDEKLVAGRTYEFVGYEDGDFVGTPLAAYHAAGVDVNFQTSDVYFRSRFVPLRTRPAAKVVFAPGDFVGRTALLEGTAVTRGGAAFVEGPGWRLLVRRAEGWPQWMEGKAVESQGLVRRGDDDETFRAEGATVRLVRLEDQVGRPVELRGVAAGVNGHWWFEYRGRAVYVDGLEALPGWDGENHGRPVVIRGTLGRGPRPDLRRVTTDPRPPLKEYFVVSDASWAPAGPLLSPERAEGVER